ncbi:uncharacterized protein LOC108100471 [Drosophila ficusphila]|uniref:uncharacterized protein LOC108100471 n=1 Tax=Drosophila ficusphila TaxID=30025 RepID=UPI0007E88077|nr:uncharacterized protein LOC108100471 [Drosophila ficusphila]
MDFFTALSTLGNSESVAGEYACAFLQAVTSDPQNWIVKVSHKFVGQCFRILGLNFNVSEEAFSRTQDHPYRNDNANYIFDPVPSLMKEVDSFFIRLPSILAEFGDELAKAGYRTRFDELTQPFPCYLSLIIKWIRVVHALDQTMELHSRTSSDRFLCEPLSRMSFSILGGLAKLLPKYGEDVPRLKEICISLSVDVRYGILYQDTCPVVVPPMLNMFKENYTIFGGPEKSALDFVYCILTVVETNDDSYIQAYEFLEAMINKFAKIKDQSQNLYLRPFTNELISGKYLVLIFEKLTSSNSRLLLLSALKYLMTLQRHVVSTECFTVRFHEALLQVVLRMQNSAPSVATLAAEVYITMSQRQHQDRDIAQQILETYAKINSNPRKNITYAQFRNELRRYLKTLIRHFPALQEFEFYASLLTAKNVRYELSVIAAQSASIVFEMHMAGYNLLPEACEQVNKFLRCWPLFLQSSISQTRPVLYSFYGMIDFDSVAQNDVDLLLTLETFCLDHFLNDDTLGEAELYGLYNDLSRSVDETGNIQIHTTAARALRDQQSELKDQLDKSNSSGPEKKKLLDAYAKSIRRLHALLMANKLHSRYVVDIYETLVKYVLEMPTQNDSITLYGSECLAAILILLYKDLKESDDEMGVKITVLVKQLQEFCVSKFSNVNLDLKRAKFFFCSILILYISPLPFLTLDSSTYDKLLDLLTTPLPSQPENDLLANSYLPEMHIIFRQLIRAQHIELPSNRIWKVLMQYKMSANTLKYLDPEIEELIADLLECRVESYVHCLPIIELRICNENNVKKRALDALNAHLALIDKHASTLDSWLLRFIILQNSLNVLNKNMRIRRFEATSSRKRNRLLPLQHFMNLVSNLRLQEKHFLSIAKMLHTLKEEAIGPQENSEIENFITKISVFKYQVEDEQLEATNNENFEGKLIELPPGPLNFWQHNALHDNGDSST